MIKIQYFRRTAYGNTHFYVKDKEQAEAVQQLTNCKTITDSHIAALIRLGIQVEEVIDPRLAHLQTF
jgi:hypothetical protein